jgi:glycosyltransferase involved in cell wall biosynthesis
MTMKNNLEIAVIIPAYNEEASIEKVINDFSKEDCNLYICIVNNNSSDNTKQIVMNTFSTIFNKCILLNENKQGKANAIRYAFRRIDADIYVMVDGDNTYFADDIHKLIKPVLDDEADMVVGDRLSKGIYKHENKRKFHSFGNMLVCRLINLIYKSNLNDIMSGYRVMSKAFVKNYPILKEGFELETDITLHALDKKYRVLEIPINYRDRVDSFSKLNTFKDGFRVIKTIIRVFKDYKPLAFFSIIFLFFFIIGIIIGAPVIIEFIETQYIKHVPLAILASGFMIISFLMMAIGIILDTIAQNHKFNYELTCLRDEKI